MPDDTDLLLRRIIGDVLGISPAQTARFTRATPLFGHLPQLDSMAVAGLLTEIEDRARIVIDDDEVDGDLLGTYGALLAFVTARRLGTAVEVVAAPG